MKDDPTPAPAGDPLRPLRGKLPPGWECWVGMSGLLYARRRKTSPPILVRDVTAAGLAAKVAEAERRLRR